MKKQKLSVYENALQLLVVGAVTGVFAGAIVTLYNLCAKQGEAISRDCYAFVRANPVCIPLLLLVIGLGAFLLSVAVYFVPMVKGSGIPQTEGATRGVLHFKWYRDAAVMFAASLVSIFMGLSAGSEGPSLHIGAASGEGVAHLLKRNEMIRRYQVTGGACAGLAVAFNAPLTGMAFAFEEAHKRFTPEVFICAFSSVIFALITRGILYSALQLTTESFFTSYVFPHGAVSDFRFYLFIVLSATVCGVVGVLLYKTVFFIRSVFGKIHAKTPFQTTFFRILIAVLIGGVAALITAEIMGGGHHLIEGLGTHGGTSGIALERTLGLSLVGTLLLVCALKFLLTGVNMGAGVPCGAFIPMLAVGACIGALLNLAWTRLGMDAAYCDFLVMVCMAAFFTAIVKAPITGIVMVCELTWNFSALLPVVIGVSIGYFIGDLSRTDSIYEKLLELYEEESGVHANAVRTIFSFAIARGAIAEKREIRDVLWSSGARVTEILRGEERIVPEGDTVLLCGDVLTIEVKTSEPQKVKDELTHILD
ncbi:MAG: ClC family H(+)/Cl(-) exchange transporter [Clostridia bacterium]|nr:ClC family H(+)/Cl(-) exchange transporter [Clostridia bacterium]